MNPRKLHRVDYLVKVGLATSRQSAYRLARLGLVPSVRIGRRVLVEEDQISSFLQGGGAATPGACRAPGRELLNDRSSG